MIVPLYKGKGERTDCKKYRGIISLLNVVEKIYAVIFVDRVHSDWGFKGVIDDEQRGFRLRKGCVDQIFILNQI